MVSGMKYVGSMICTAVSWSQVLDVGTAGGEGKGGELRVESEG